MGRAGGRSEALEYQGEGHGRGPGQCRLKEGRRHGDGWPDPGNFLKAESESFLMAATGEGGGHSEVTATSVLRDTQVSEAQGCP